MYFCPNCDSTNVLIERRMDGNGTCHECGYRSSYKNFIYKEPKGVSRVKPTEVVQESVMQDTAKHIVGDIRNTIYKSEVGKKMRSRDMVELADIIENSIKEKYHIA